MRRHFDFVIIGGGIFGVYAALYLARHGQSVCLIEKETALFRKASIVNQARLHSDYHYPRSVATARMSDDNKARFTAEHRDFINADFEKYYAIDRFGSFTDSQQFERFCSFINIPCEPVRTHQLFNFERIEALYKTVEYSFDPILIANDYRQRLGEETKVTTFLQTAVIRAEVGNNCWELSLQRTGGEEIIRVSADQAINATYAGSNAVNALFGVADIPLMHEISEMAFLTSPQLNNIGLTVMDGPFGSLMPYGLSGLLSLSSVIYTHHKVSYANLPAFDCQGKENTCRPDFLSDCNACPAKPRTNYAKMIAQMRQYFSEDVEFRYFTSFFTIKSKLKANHIDDGRPTEISLLHDNPRFYCIFAGKINSIYEIEKAISF